MRRRERKGAPSNRITFSSISCISGQTRTACVRVHVSQGNGIEPTRTHQRACWTTQRAALGIACEGVAENTG